MKSISLLVIMASLVALLVVGTEDMGSGHVAFANRGINIQTNTRQDPTTVTLSFATCSSGVCSEPIGPDFCNNIGCTSISCPTNTFVGTFNCVTNNGVQLTSCIELVNTVNTFTCTPH